METIGIYLLKVNIGIALLYLLYRVLLSNDTFFGLRRVVLLLIPIIAFAFPAIQITDLRPEILSFLTPVSGTAGIEVEKAVITDVLNPQAVIQSGLPIDYNKLAWGIYITICIFLALRLGVQLISIGRLSGQGERDYDNDGFKLIRLNRDIKPFTFGNRIFINPDQHAGTELREILLHEQVHCRQHHTLDVMAYEVCSVLCWANPFIWLCKAEVLLNLEHLADEGVIQEGCNKRHYQYHLLQHCNGERLHPTIQFNTINFKRRIKMMNKKRNSKAGILKYGILFPALVLSAIWTQNVVANSLQPQVIAEVKADRDTDAVLLAPQEEVVSISIAPQSPAKKESKKTPPPPPKIRVNHSPQEEVVSISIDPQSPAKKDTVKKESRQAPPPPPTIKKEDESGTTEKICTKPETAAAFPGGTEAINKFLKEKMVYPQKAQDKGIQGKVVVQFIVTKDGSINDIKVVRSVDQDLDAEAIRVVKLMPKWIPGKQDGKAVNSYFTVPMSFKLKAAPQEEKTSSAK